MLDSIKTTFTISDLEKMSGISAHSIRIWERRYNLLDPLRTEGNIRRYSNEDLKKLLNISLLLTAGYKISDLATYSEQELNITVNSRLTTIQGHQHEINELKMAMLNFDTRLFEDTYNRLINSMPFTDLFLQVMIPFLEHIGTLWQTNSITVAHEHYISNLLRQKLFYQIENLPKPNIHEKELFILFLPLNEMHELGLLFIHYILLLNGRRSIYLGPSVGLPSLEGTPSAQQRVFISYLTFSPTESELPEFLKDIRKTVLRTGDQFYGVGHRVIGYAMNKTWKNIFLFSSLKDLLNQIK
ncbi:MAG: MerR family transcriptional regulator [Saprospiraceae bacterium]